MINVPTLAMVAPRIDRPFLTFLELVERWGGKANDVRFALVEGSLVPSFLVDGEYGQVAFSDGVPVLKLAEDGEESNPLHGMHYLQRPYRTGPLDCAFTFFTAEVHPSDDAAWWHLPERIALADVLDRIAIDLDQVQDWEREHKRVKDQRPQEKAAATIERASLTKMVIAMAIDGYGFDPKARRSPIIPEIAKVVKRFGMSLDDDTVRKYIYEGAEHHLPANWRQLVEQTEPG